MYKHYQRYSYFTFKRILHYLLSAMEKKPADDIKPEWLKDYTAVAILGVIFILLFFWFTSTYNLP